MGHAEATKQTQPKRGNESTTNLRGVRVDLGCMEQAGPRSPDENEAGCRSHRKQCGKNATHLS
eukprot:11809733-Alexandrium_andersonii.AAC.2